MVEEEVMEMMDSLVHKYEALMDEMGAGAIDKEMLDLFVEEKEIRHDFYRPQDGVVMEGTSELGVGMTLPASEVAIVSPQKVTSKTEESARARLTKI